MVYSDNVSYNKIGLIEELGNCSMTAFGFTQDSFLFSSYFHCLLWYSGIKEVSRDFQYSDSEKNMVDQDFVSTNKYLKSAKADVSDFLSQFPKIEELCNMIEKHIQEGKNDEFDKGMIRDAYTHLIEKYESLYKCRINNQEHIEIDSKKFADYMNSFFDYSLSDFREEKEYDRKPLDLLFDQLQDYMLENIVIKDQKINAKDYLRVRRYFLDLLREIYEVGGVIDFSEEKMGEIFGNVYFSNFLRTPANTDSRSVLKMILENLRNRGLVVDEDLLSQLANIIKPSYNNTIDVDLDVQSVIEGFVTNYLLNKNGKEMNQEKLAIAEENLLKIQQDNPLYEVLNHMHQEILGTYSK